MTLLLFDHLQEIASDIASSEHLCLFLDYDGTIAPIVENPGDADIPAETIKVLHELSAHDQVSLAIISGRALTDLRQRIGMKKIVYAGNHGLEISGPGVDFVEPAAATQIKSLGELARHLRGQLRDIEGAEVENKVLSASVHFRRAAPESRDEIDRIVRSAVESIGTHFEVTMGRKVFEIRPRVDWHKGRAVDWIRQNSPFPEALSIYIGDDATDEDAFSADSVDITVSVGRCARTAARYCLQRQQDVQQFLLWLAERTIQGEREFQMLSGH